MNERVVIVGAGLGGLSAAIHLAAAGCRVAVFERNEDVGGKASQIESDGYRWDVGPTVITLRHVLEDLFAAAGRRMDDYLTMVPMDPLTRYHYPDGAVLDIAASLAQTVANIEALAPGDLDGYLRFLAYAARQYRALSPIMLYGDPPTLADIARVPLRDVARVDFRRNMDQAISAHVRSTYLRRLLDRFATYLGASPYAARAYLNVIAHVELTAGLSYPRGGTYQISLAYRRLAEELGVTIHTAAPVVRILTDDGAATGIELSDRSVERADALIANVDATTVYHDLLPDGRHRRRLGRWLNRPFSCSGFVLYLGLDRQHPHLAHNNIFFSPDYPTEFASIFRRGLPPREPTVYVAITSRTDPDHAPPGGENWYVMVNAPPVSAAWDWEREASAYREVVLDRLAAYGLDVRGQIRAEHVLSPLDIQRRTGAWRGALYGHSFNNPLASFQRPNIRCPDVRRLYFAGGTTHPAGGVPMVTLSGKTAARLLLTDLRGG
ncbi:MAG: phytoene desaturase [Anaerolineae bacterium]|nr:phytoene desaturase [Anaerolineae bacterium]